MAGSGCNAYQIRKIYAIGGALGMVKRNEEDDLLHELVEGMTGKKSIKALTPPMTLPLLRCKYFAAPNKAHVVQ